VGPVELYVVGFVLTTLILGFHKQQGQMNTPLIIKYSRANSLVNWLSSEKTKHFKDHLCPRLQGTDQYPEDEDRTEMVLEMLVFHRLTN
jgi:hypothetical protein